MTTTQIGIKIGLQGAESVTSGLAGVQNSLGSLAGRVETVRSALSGFAPALASAFTVGGLVAFVRNTTNAIDAMNDLADATGSTIEEISKLDQVARRNGASLDAVGGMLVKFNAALKEADGKNGASIALQAIGLEAAKLRQLDPSEALRQTAVALAGFADDGNKARIVQELFGKSVREAAPFLKDLAEAGTLSAKVTKEQAEEAEKFNKQLSLLGANATDAARGLVSDLIPALNDTLTKFNQFSRNGGVLGGFFTLLVSQFKDARVQATLEEIGRLEGRLANPNVTGFNRSTLQQELGQANALLRELQGEAVKASTALDKALGRPSAGGGRGFVNPANALAAPSAADIAAEQARRKAAEESAAAVLKQQEAYDKLRVSIEERISAGQLELTQGQALTEAQRLKIKLDQDYASGLLKLTPAQKAVLDGKVADLAATEGQVKAEQESLKAAKAAAEARADARRAEDRAIAEFQAAESARASASLASVKDRITSLQDEAKAADLVANLNISLAEALELVTIARLEEKKAQYQVGSEPYLAVQREIDARKELANLIGSSAAREANRRSAEDAAREWQRTADQIGQSLTDALMQGGKSAWEYIKGLFRSMVLRPVIQAIVNPIAGAFTGSMGGPGAMGTLGGINSLATLSSAVTGGFTSSIANVLGTAGTVFGSSALTAFSAGMKGATLAPGLMGPTTAGASGAMGAGASVAAAVPYVAAALAVANALGVFRSKSIVGGGLTGTLGMGDIQSYDLQRRGGTLFSGPDYSLVNRQTSTESAAIQSAFEALRSNAASMAEALGLSSTAVKSFTTVLGTDITQNDIGTRGIKLDGLTPEQAAKKVEEALAAANEDLAAFVLGASRTVTETITTSVEDWAEGENDRYLRGYLDQVSEVTRTIEATGPTFARTGETAVQTLTRLASSISTINPVLETLNLKLYDTSLAGADLASQLADAFGGLEAFTQATGTYYQEFFSEAERAANTTEQLTKALGGLGLALPTTRDEFRALVEAQDLSTESGRKAFATLVGLSGTFASLVPAVEAVGQASSGAAQALRSAADVLNERQGLERELLTLQGDTAALRALDRDALDQSNRALYDRITALQDSQAAEAAAADATRTAATEAGRIAQERQGLERRLLELQGDQVGIRAIERAALDESNRALYDQITALQDSKNAATTATEAERTLAAERERLARERPALERQLLELQGGDVRAYDTRGFTEAEIAAYDYNQSLREQIELLRAAGSEIKTASNVASERVALEKRLLQLTGNTAALRAQERNLVDESNRSLYDQVEALGEVSEAMQRANISAQSIAAVLRDGMLGRIAEEDVGAQLSELLVGGIYNALATTYAEQITQTFINGIVQPMVAALLAGQNVAQAVSQASIDAMVAQARASMQALGQVLSDPALQAALSGISMAVGDVASVIPTSIPIRPYTPTASQQESTSPADESASRVASERQELERRLLQLQGRTVELRLSELAALDPSNRALQEQIWLLEDQQSIAQERAGLERELVSLQADAVALRNLEREALDASNRSLYDQVQALREAQSVQNERDGLERRLLELRGDTAAIREQELTQLDESNRALQQQIYELEDARAGATAAMGAANDFAKAWQSVVNSLIDEARRIRGLLAVDSSMGYAALQSRFVIATAQARAGDAEAAKLLASYASELVGAASDQVASRLELVRLRANVAQSLEQTGTILSAVVPGQNTTQPIDQLVASNQDLNRTVAELKAEVIVLKQHLSAIQTNTRRTADATNGLGEAPMVVEVEP